MKPENVFKEDVVVRAERSLSVIMDFKHGLSVMDSNNSFAFPAEGVLIIQGLSSQVYGCLSAEVKDCLMQTLSLKEERELFF
jgi:hypothetical protein